MVTYFEATAARMVAVKDDHIVFDTSAKSVNLFPDSYNIVRSRAGGNPISVEFPAPLKGNAYRNWSKSGGITQCWSFSTMFYQEWGPDFTDTDDWWSGANPTTPAPAMNYRNLPQEYLGSVPAGTDYIDVRINMENTVVPPQINDFPIIKLIPENVEVNLPGGSCPIELRSPLVRLFEFKLIGLDVYLRRFQSVPKFVQVPWLTGNSDATLSGWTWRAISVPAPKPGFPTAAFRADYGILAHSLDYKEDTTGTKRRNGTNSCSVVDPYDFRSVWYGDVTIRPGRRT